MNLMIEEEIYNIKTLRWVALGLFISTISSILLGVIGHLHIAKIIYAMQIVGLVTMGLGLRQIRKYLLFDKCYKSSLCITGYLIYIRLPDFIANYESLKLLISLTSGIFSLIAIIAVIYLLGYLMASISQIAHIMMENKFSKLASIIGTALTIIIALFFICLLFSARLSHITIYPQIIFILRIIFYIIIFISCILIYLISNKLAVKEKNNEG